MGSSVSTIVDQSSNVDLSIPSHERLEAERKRIRVERWYSNVVREELGIPVEFLRVHAPIEDGEMQANQDPRKWAPTSGCTSMPEEVCEGKRNAL